MMEATEEAASPKGVVGRGRALRISLAAGLLVSCATPGPPETFRFASNHDPANALRCASNRLRIEGFELVEPSADSATTVAIRRTESAEDVGATEWWRVELSIAQDEARRTVVQSVAGAARREEGPFAAPGVVLQGIVGKISASCTW